MTTIAINFFIPGMFTTLSILWAAEGRWGYVIFNTILSALQIGVAIALMRTQTVSGRTTDV